MPQPIDVGSVLGGRYRVTAQVLASAEHDLVLEGVDQVLNRSVSILLAAPENAGQVTASAREVATGERHGSVQVLDLGVSDGRTYLVTSSANAADLLDLVIERDAPYVEPFFTDTLGSEIFGMPRSSEPQAEEDGQYEEERSSRSLRGSLHRPRKLRSPRGSGASAAVAGAEEDAALRGLEYGDAADVPAEAATGGGSLPPLPAARPRNTARGRDTVVEEDNPKVSRWSAEDLTAAAPVAEHTQPTSSIPRSTPERDYDDGDGDGGYDDYDGYDSGDDDGEASGGNRRSGRILVGVVLSIVLICAVVLSVSTMSNVAGIFAGDSKTTASPTQAPVEESAAAPAPAEEPAVEAVAPVTTAVSRLVPGNPTLDSANDAALSQIIDDNPNSYWSSYVYANDTFGGLATSLALVVELEQESSISEVKINQLNGTGGSYSVLLNNTPSLEGAESVAQNGFTGPTTSIPVPKTDGAAPTAQYVIINFTQLPRLNGVQAQYPWGLRIAEIAVS